MTPDQKATTPPHAGCDGDKRARQPVWWAVAFVFFIGFTVVISVIVLFILFSL
jgi:hypothetical protein